MDLLYVGLILVGSVLSIKVFTEGRTHLDKLNYKRKQYQESTQLCNLKAEEQEKKTHSIKALIEKLNLEINALKTTRDQMRAQTRDIKSKLGQSHKVLEKN